MASVGRVENVQEVIKALKERAKRYLEDSEVRSKSAGRDASVIVGYTAAYALYVHENLEMKWKGLPRALHGGRGFYWDPPGKGQSKFLEQPARQYANEIGEIVRGAIKRGATLAKGLLLGGLRLQRESQLLVPVDTGNLKASAFTRLE